MDSSIKTFFNKSLTHSLNGSNTHAYRFVNLIITAPAIGLVNSSNEELLFFIAQGDDVPFGHGGMPKCSSHILRSMPVSASCQVHQQPQLI